jgi:phospholipase A1
MDEVEAKFQLSFQFDIWKNMFAKDIDLYFAYTQLAFWQVYNTQASSLFRETNYEPEAGLIFHPDFDILGLNNNQIRFGLVHQSNGRAEPLSRSWNRIFGMFMLQRGRFSTVFRPWYRIPEDEEDDDNPDIEDFMGHFEWYSSYKWRKHTISVLLRNNLKTSENRGGIRLDLSYPLTDRLKLYLQYFNGYGESLIDYNHANNRIGVGLILTEWKF